MTNIFLASVTKDKFPAAWDWKARPLCVLVSFAYLRQWRGSKTKRVFPRRTMLDSGAFTAYNIGKTVDIDALISEVATGGWDEAVGLDVIGSAEGSKRNADYMRARGCMAMPVFHIGDPWDLLHYYCQHWPKVGLSCRFGESRADSMAFYSQCFAREWPHRFHSFGWIDEAMLRTFPLHSADASTWYVPATFNNFLWKVGGVVKQRHLSLTAKGAEKRHLRDAGLMQSLDHVWRLENILKARWATEMARLEAT